MLFNLLPFFQLKAAWPLTSDISKAFSTKELSLARYFLFFETNAVLSFEQQPQPYHAKLLQGIYIVSAYPNPRTCCHVFGWLDIWIEQAHVVKLSVSAYTLVLFTFKRALKMLLTPHHIHTHIHEARYSIRLRIFLTFMHTFTLMDTSGLIWGSTSCPRTPWTTNSPFLPPLYLCFSHVHKIHLLLLFSWLLRRQIKLNCLSLVVKDVFFLLQWWKLKLYL